MRLSKYFVPTLKEVPNDAVVTSHILMLRAGMVRMVSAGIYSFLPLGYSVMKKISEIIREEMDAIGGQEFHLPALNPKEIWEETGRVEAFGDILFHIKNREYVLAPTHEEIMTYHARNVVKSYKDMPQIWYQIQTKFRNEPRPRSGVIRGRQFLMKDSYTFDTSWEALDKSYDLHDQAYRKIFDRCGLKYFVVGASSGAMGGTGSEEFMMKSEAGEDTVAYCESCGYAANVQVATSRVEGVKRDSESKIIYEISTPNVKSIDELCAFLKIDETQCAKSRIYIHNGEAVLILMLGNDEVNETKLEKVLGGTVRPGHPDELKEITGADAGSIGPVGFKGKIIADYRLKDANNMFSGANKNDYHTGGIDFIRDVKNVEYADLRIVKSGEGCSKCEKNLEVFSAIELGHIFKLGTKYSESMGAKFIDEKGEEHPIIMGSYGIGVDRIFACFIEQHHDEKGIIWENPLAPFDVHLIALNLKNETVIAAANKIYDELEQNGVRVLFDDRDAAAGFKFNDADLLGMPIQIVVGEKKLKDGKCEVKIRKTGERFDVEVTKLRKMLEIYCFININLVSAVEKSLIEKGNFVLARNIEESNLDHRGFYCVKLLADSFLPTKYQSLLEKRNHRILYIGKADSQTLKERFLYQELRAKGHGTFFRSMGVVLGFTPPKGSLRDKTNQNNYTFLEQDRERIINWINTNLEVSWIEYNDDFEIEKCLIKKYCPFLNDKYNPMKLEQLSIDKKMCRMIARS